MAGTGKAHLRDTEDIVLRVEDLVVEFPVGRTGLKVNAVSGISFDVRRGETLGLVGESGCGKSTTGRAIMQLPRPTSGSVRFEDTELTQVAGDQMREARTRMQMIFQDPISSLNPRRKVRQIVMEPLTIWSRGDIVQRSQTVDRVLEQVGIDPQRAAESQPHQFSGGQCQRISIARSLVLDPSLIICDEPVSALDVSVQAQVLNLLEDLKKQYGLTMIFIAHDLAVVKNVSDRVAVMYLGKICEVGPSDELYHHPAHHYTAVLLNSIPVPDPEIAITKTAIEGEPPSPVLPPPGCRFHTRCPAVGDVCKIEEPQLRLVGDDHYVACHFPLVTPVHVTERDILGSTPTNGQTVASDVVGGPPPEILEAEQAARKRPQRLAEHDKGNLSLILSLVSFLTCGLIAPFVWIYAWGAMKEMKNQPEVTFTNRWKIVAGLVLSVIATIGLAVAVLLFLASWGEQALPPDYDPDFVPTTTTG